MNFIKPHLDEFYPKYEVMFDGNDYFVRISRGNDYPWDCKREYYWCKFGALAFLFFIRLSQHRELKKEKKRKARQLLEPIKIA